MIRCLVGAMGRYLLLAKAVRITPSKERNQLKAIEATARKLLLQLGVNPNDVMCAFRGRLSDRPSWEQLQLLSKKSKYGISGLNMVQWLAVASINTTDKDSAAVNAELREASAQVADAIIALLDLHQRAKTARQTVTERIQPRRGGSRHRPTAEGQLTRDAITIYAHMRKQYPHSGNKPGYGGPMLRFVHAVAELYGVRLRDADVHDAWRARGNQNRNNFDPHNFVNPQTVPSSD